MRHLHVFLYHLVAILYVAWVFLLLFVFMAGMMVADMLSLNSLLPISLALIIQIPLVPYFYKKLIAWDMRHRLGVAVPHTHYPRQPGESSIIPTITDL